MAEPQINQKLALEMTMQEVLGNIEELALDFGYSDSNDCFEILSIEAPDKLYAAIENRPTTLIRSPLISNTTPLQQKKQRVA